VGDVHIALNARHLMNPANRADLGGMRVIDVVRARRPRILLVNIGPNHGLLDITLRGDAAAGLDACGASCGFGRPSPRSWRPCRTSRRWWWC
jgi:hypothetical protein